MNITSEIAHHACINDHWFNKRTISRYFCHDISPHGTGRLQHPTEHVIFRSPIDRNAAVPGNIYNNVVSRT